MHINLHKMLSVCTCTWATNTLWMENRVSPKPFKSCSVRRRCCVGLSRVGGGQWSLCVCVFLWKWTRVLVDGKVGVCVCVGWQQYVHQQHLSRHGLVCRHKTRLFVVCACACVCAVLYLHVCECYQYVFSCMAATYTANVKGVVPWFPESPNQTPFTPTLHIVHHQPVHIVDSFYYRGSKLN